MEKEKFASEIKIFLKKRGIKQNDLAKELGVSHPVVSNVVNGRDRLGRQSAIKWGGDYRHRPSLAHDTR